MIFLVALAASVFFLIYIGIQYFAVPGEKQKQHALVTQVLIGIIFLSLASIIPTLILSFLK